MSIDTSMARPGRERVAVVVLTGFLGSGKTTLLNHILSNNKGLRVGVLVNELGSVDIDSQLVDHTAEVKEDRVELKNGCVCCTIQGELQSTALSVLSRPGGVDYLVIETTGVADPNPIVFTFEKDAALSARCFVESVVTVVNAEAMVDDDVSGSDSGGDGLESFAAVRAQLDAGDVIIVNKTDLVPKTTAQLLVGAIQEKYPTTLVLTSSFGVVPLNAVLAASTDDRFGCVDAGIPRHKHAVTRDTLDKTTTSDSHDAHSHDHGHDHDGSDCAECKCDPRSTSSHLVDDGFVSVAFTSSRPLVAWKFSNFLRNHVPRSVVRMKGILALSLTPAVPPAVVVMHKSGRRYSLQSAGQYGVPVTKRGADVVQLVLIGTRLDKETVLEQLQECVVPAVATAAVTSGAGGTSPVAPDHVRIHEAQASGSGSSDDSGAGAGVGAGTGTSPLETLGRTVRGDHRFFWRSIGEPPSCAAFGLTGVLGFAAVLDEHRRSELTRELILRVNRSVEPVFLLPVVIKATGASELVGVVDCRDEGLDVALLWKVVERETVPVLTQAFAAMMCC